MPVGPGQGSVLVLGSGGVIGQRVVAWLRDRGYNILEVRDRGHFDLRVEGVLDAFDGHDVRYCMFLACEVGGAKFIESSQQDVQVGIILSNVRMYQSVLPWLHARGIPFVFSSSYLQGTHNGYGSIKRLGESWIHALGGLGRVLRLWNVYGVEQVGLKSHVLSDWAQQCAGGGAGGGGGAASLTDGREERQFVHADDAAAALGIAMQRHWEIEEVSDVSSGEWISMREAAGVLSAAAGLLGGGCNVVFNGISSPPRERLSPVLNGTLHKHWKAQISLQEGCRRLLEEYGAGKGGVGKPEL